MPEKAASRLLSAVPEVDRKPVGGCYPVLTNLSHYPRLWFCNSIPSKIELGDILMELTAGVLCMSVMATFGWRATLRRRRRVLERRRAHLLSLAVLHMSRHTSGWLRAG